MFYCVQLYVLFTSWALSVTDTRKMEKLQENALLFIYNDYYKSYIALLLLSSKDSLHVSGLKCIVLEIFKILILIFMNELFTKKCISYDLRDDYILEIPRYNTVTYGFNSLEYQGTWKSLDCIV